jgi:hypothetical protein
MCSQTTYTLPCEHVRTIVTYCPAAQPIKKAPHTRKPCANTSHTSVPYPPPSGFGYDQFSSSLPKCPLASCPFEQRNRCWNCCWCGKSWNVGGRCSCVMIIDGNEYSCDHICCSTCEAASD